MSGFPIKISAYLRPVLADQDAWEVTEDEGVSIEAANFGSLQSSNFNPNITFSKSVGGYLGSGYMAVGDLLGGAASSTPKMMYPIKFAVSGQYRFFIRVLSNESSISLRIGIGDADGDPQSVAISTPGEWEWVEVEQVVPESGELEIWLEVHSVSVLIDSIHITAVDFPDLIEFDPRYVTVHARMYSVADGIPQTELPCYMGLSTLESLRIDDWYNFDMRPLPGNDEPSEYSGYSFALFMSGNTDQSYISWDYLSDFENDPYNPQCSLRYDEDSDTWIQDCDKQYALKAFAYQDSLDSDASKLVTPASALSSKVVQQFAAEVEDPIYFNTKIVTVDSGSDKIELSLPDRIVSLLVDQSGSMTWNDSDGLRHDLSRRMISRVDATYPGDVKWNVFSFEGTPIRVNFFAAVESNDINTNNADEISSSFFGDQESGYAGVRVVRKIGSYPDNALDGEIVAEGFLDRAYDDNLESGENYFYTVYTFNENGTFSPGVDIAATPRERVIPRGIGQFSANILRGTGVIRDENVVALWHFNEAAGLTVYDFTESQIHLSAADQIDPVWLNPNDVPSGLSGVRLDGNRLYFTGTDASRILMDSDESTFMAWVFPFSDLGTETFLARESDSQTDFNIGRIDGTIYFTTNYSDYVTGSGLVAEQWNHIAISIKKSTKLVTIYINGSEVASSVYGGSFTANCSLIGVGSSRRFSNQIFFGKITEVSFHSDIRSSSYIYDHSVEPEEESDKVLDNGDRLVILNFSVPEDYDFSGGNVRIVEKEAVGDAVYSFTGETNEDGSLEKTAEGFGFAPYHENDGDVIYEAAATAGAFSVTLHKNFVHGRVYHYKIFSQNAAANFSNWSDSPVLSITIPEFEDNNSRNEAIDEPSPSLYRITSVTVRTGNRKNHIRWTYSSSDDRVEQVRVYYSSDAYPIFGDGKDVSGADLIFSGNTDQLSFVHRNIENNAVAYYAILTMDKYGYRSEPYYFQNIPQETADESAIPLLDVSKVRYEIVSDEAMSLAWDQPVRLQKNVEAWFDDRVALFAQITDEFGVPIVDDSRISFVAEASTTSAQNAENVFTDSIERESFEPRPEETFILSSAPLGNGLIKGIIRMTTDASVLSAVNELILSVRIFFSIPSRENESENVFEFRSMPISVKMNNPFKVELVNQSGDIVRHLCKQEVPLSDSEFISTGGLLFDPNLEKDFDGTFIRRSRPFVARVKAWYRDRAIPSGGQTFVAVYEASDPGCDDPDGGSGEFIPTFFETRSLSVLPPATTLAMRIGIETDSDGVVSEFSYADIPLPPPGTPQGVMLFSQVSYNGYIARKKMYIAFENILRVELTANQPEPNCIDQAEQFANVYLIDPDSSNPLRPDRSRIPENELCKWTLQRGLTGRDRPFFSLDTIPNGPGVFSYIRSGTARRVFFGPACGVTWTTVDLGPENGGIALLPEMYAIKATVVYDGLTAFEERPVVIYPPNALNSFGSRIMMQFNDFLNEVYADGYDYEAMTIHRDPNSAGGRFGSVFRACSESMNGTLLAMNYGQVVELESGDEFEILFGEDISISLDPYLDEYVFENETQEIGFASVPLSSSSDTTNVFLRINKFIGSVILPDNRESSGSVTNRCPSIEIPPGFRRGPNDRNIIGRSSVVVDGNTRFLTGGGDLQSGIPPTVIRMKEPLSIRIVDIRINDEPVEAVLIDGQTEHVFLVEVSFSGKPVPNGTPVFLQTGGRNPSKISLYENTIYTTQYEDEFLLAGIKSYAQFTIFPLNPSESFSAQILTECRYDKRGDVSRSMTACVTISYDSEAILEQDVVLPGGQIDNVFSGNLSVFDSQSSEWSDLASLTHPRGGLTLSWTGDEYGTQIYAIGGINGKSITSYCERYDIGVNAWTDVALLSTPRFHHMSVEDSGNIYVFGGITIEAGGLMISRSVEMYDPSVDEWSSVSDMPEINGVPYGVALGSVLKIDNLVYILCGITAIGERGSIAALNDRVLVYDLNTDEWSYTDVFADADLEMYARLSPFAFVDASDQLQVVGGAILSDESLEFVTDAFALDPELLSISSSDSNYQNIPRPRYKGGLASIDDEHYALGGANKKSSVLRTFEKITDGSPFGYDEVDQPEIARQSFGITSDQDRYIYVAGGITNGRPAGFLRINATVRPGRVRLDGKQSAGIDIELLNDVGEHPAESIRVVVRGYLIFPNSESASQEGMGGGDQGQAASGETVDRQSMIYPVVFSSNDFLISNGFGTTTLLPRSDDILRKIDEIKEKLGIETAIGEGAQDNLLLIEEGKTREPYDIRIQITVVDDVFYGQTVVDLSDSEDPDQSSDEADGASDGASTDGSSSGSDSPFAGEFTGCIGIDGVQQFPSGGNEQQDPNGDVILEGLDDNSVVFQLNPTQLSQLESPTVSCYCDVEWIPQIIPHLDENIGTAEEALEVIDRLRNSVAFGGSPFYDGIYKITEVLLDEDFTSIPKIIYAHTDNEENLSFIGLTEAIDEVQAINGFGQTPVILNNFSVVFPTTLSAMVARTDTDSLEQLARDTGGQSQTILDAVFIDEVLNNTLGRVSGSIGWGTYEAVVDIGADAIVHNVQLDFDLFDNTDGSWKIASSSDGFNFSEDSDQYESDALIEFSELSGRYFRFRVTLLSGLSASTLEEYESTATPGAPALLSIDIGYSIPRESFIFVNAESPDYSAQQISVAIRSNRPTGSVIDVGAATSDSYNWADYQNGSQPVANQFGKVFIPVRTQQTDTALNEPLISIDGIVWKAKYGSWNPESAVVIKDADEEVIDSGNYRAYPRNGLIVFNTRVSGALIIDIENASKTRLGIRIVNKYASEPVEIEGCGFFYNTNVFLPIPLSERPPEASNLQILTAAPNVYSKIEASYLFSDLNRDQEDTDQTDIRWYINGVEREYLRGLLEWNDLSNYDDPVWVYGFSFDSSDVPAGSSVEEFARTREESLLRVDDLIYFTVKPHDGKVFGTVARSSSVRIVAAPPSVTSLEIRGRTVSGVTQPAVTTATTAYASYNFFDDGGDNASTIIWYVNEQEFKRGSLGGTTAGFPNNEIAAGEVRTASGIVAISIGNDLEVEIRPAAGQTLGSPVRSAVKTVENAPPEVSSVAVSPERPTSSSNIQVSYSFNDIDIRAGLVSQSNQSSIRWYRKRGSSGFEEVVSALNSEVVLNTLTATGDQWYAEIIPFDGVSVGTTVRSNTVTIG